MDSKQDTSFGQCRCCLAKGHHRDLMREYYCNGIREVYFDIFMDCYNLFLSTEANLSTLICTPCVQRLREASSFRMMVVGTERQLLEALKKTDDKNMMFVNVPVQESLKDLDVKQETEPSEWAEVKEEPGELADRDDTDGDPDFDLGQLPSDDTDGDSTFEDKLTSIPERKHKAEDEKDEQLDALVPGEASLLSRCPAPRLPTRRTLRRTCPEYAKHIKLLKADPELLRIEIVQLHQRGVSARGIARQLQCARTTVATWIRRYNNEGNLNDKRKTWWSRKTEANC